MRRNRIYVYISEDVPQLRRLVAGFPPLLPGLDERSGRVGFVVNERALGLVFFESLGFYCQLSFHQQSHIH
jgi:hypothetical protein